MADQRKVPIDLAYNKLLEALIDRRIVPQKWLEQHKQIRDGLAKLYTDLPLLSEDLAAFRAKHVDHEQLHYFDCKHVMSCLQSTDEGAARNFFGQYTSPVLKQWDALLKMYEKNNVFAADAARHIAHNTAYEIPFLKKAMHQNEKQVADNNRKIQDLNKSIAEYKRKLETSCANMGIQGESIREELQRLPRELPTMFSDLARVICSEELAEALAYHQALQTYLHKCEVPVSTTTSGSTNSKKDKKKKEAVVVEEAIIVEPHAFFSAIEQLRAASDEEVGSSFDFEAEAAEISWDISVDESGSGEAATIDWGIETLSTEPTSADETPIEIDWDITSASDVVDISSEAFVEDVSAGITMEPAAASTRVGLMSESDFRAQALNDLLELRAFLQQRAVELAATSENVAFANQFHGSSVRLEQQSVEQIRQYQTAVTNAIDKLTDKRLQQLVLIQNSERYLDRHVASLEMLTTQMEKCHREIITLEDKNVDLIDATSKMQPQIDSLAATTKKLKKELEAALPPLFKGFKVNIIGEVNSL